MTSEIVTKDQTTAALPAFVKKGGESRALAGMQAGLGRSVNRISLKGSRFTLIQANGNEIPSPNLYLDVIITGVAIATQRSYFDKAYDPKDDITPACHSLNGKYPDPDVDKKQSVKCEDCPQNVRQPDPRRPGKEYRPCGFNKPIVVTLAGDKTTTPWLLNLSSMTFFNSEVYKDANVMTWDGLVKTLLERELLPEHVVIRLMFDPDASVPVLTFSIVELVGASAAYTEEMYNGIMHRIETHEIEKLLYNGKTEEEVVNYQPSQVSTPEPEPEPAPAPAPEPAPTPADESIEKATENATDASAADFSAILAQFQS